VITVELDDVSVGVTLRQIVDVLIAAKWNPQNKESDHGRDAT